MTADLNRSITDRLRHRAAEDGVEAGRLRRHFVFERILARLSSSSTWVLKGGFCLEVRFGLDARATRDLDLATTERRRPSGPLDVQDVLDSALADDLGDGFTFDVALPRAISPDEAGNPGWRTTIAARVGGKQFETVRLDLVARHEEIVGATELLTVTPLLPEFGTVRIQAVDVAQHAAEKIHAYARIYAYDRPSSRVKDLVDLVLLVEAGLLDPLRWGTRIGHVFAVRDSGLPPPDLPTPPGSWNGPYRAAAAELGLAAATTASAHQVVAEQYRAALTAVRTSRNEI